MPATESTWRDTGRMHRIFAVSGVVLTLATVWMFYKDHARHWKTIQPTVVNIDLKMNQWRQEQFATTEAVGLHDQLSVALSAAKARPLDPDLLAKFKQQLGAPADWIDEAPKTQAPLSNEADKLRKAATEARRAADAKPNDSQLHVAAVEAEKAALDAEQAAAAERDRVLARLRSIVTDAKNEENIALGRRKFKSAEIDEARAERDIAIRDNLGAAEIGRREARLQKLVGREGDGDESTLLALNLKYQGLSAHRKTLEGFVTQMTAEADEAQKKYDDSLAALDRLATQFRQQEETWFTNPLTTPYPFVFGKKWLTLPILDAFGTPRKIENLWSDGLMHTYGSFGSVRRFDRCTTCHMSLAKSLPGAPTDPAYIQQQILRMVVTPPDKNNPQELPKQRFDDEGQPIPFTVEDWLGIRLAEEALLPPRDDVTVSLVLPKSPAARAALANGAQDPGKTGQELRSEVAQFTAAHGEPANPFPTVPGLMVGDVIEGINGSVLQGGDRGPKRVGAMLLTLAQEGKPIKLQIRRGLPNPYISHPRLDLYVSDASPHRLQTFACTVCHDGQGSATEFKFASHTPNDQIQAGQWVKEHGWFDNHHWIFPMYPKRFAESACLKCHHEVVDLEASEKFPDPPAPKVVHGYQLIRKYGCYGCHEINGFDGPIRRIGPDLRVEPSYFAAAQALLPLLPARLAHYDALAAQLTAQVAPAEAGLQKLTDDKTALDQQKAGIAADAPDKDQQTKAIDQQMQSLIAQIEAAQKKLAALRGEIAATGQHGETILRATRLATGLVTHPEHDVERRELFTILDYDVQIAAENKDRPLSEQQWTTFDAKIQSMANWFKDQEAPGDQRKPGPSLRFLAAKVDRTFLYDWLNNPKNFRQSTRMPQFFGLWDHLKNAQGEMIDRHAPELEPIEIRGMIEFLMAQSEPLVPAKGNADVAELVRLYEPLPREPGIDPWTDEEKVARGKIQFQTRGCLACHTHADFPDVSKFRSPDEIVQGPDLSGVGDKFSPDRNPSGPDWLYSWIKEPTRYHVRTVMPNLFLGPERDPGADPMTTDDDRWFDPADDIASYLLASKSNWRPVPAASTAGEPLDAAGLSALEKLTMEYLNEAFYKDAAEGYYRDGIPTGMESELKGAEKDLIVPQGQQLSNTQRLRYIGRKTIAKYGCFGCHDIPGFEDAKPIGTSLADWGRKDPARLAFEHITHYVNGHGHAAHAPAAHATDGAHAAPATHDTDAEQTEEYYHHALESGNRIGFIQQKLKEPRSYDFEKTENKRYNERLRMPQFPFSLDEREAIITFVLGLVADPPREKYIFTPTPRNRALIAGRQVLEKYNCGGCHLLGLEKWRVSYAPGTYGQQTPPGQPTGYPFLKPPVSPLVLKTQATPDHRNLLYSDLVGMPKLSPRDGLPELFLSEDNSSITDEDVYKQSELKLTIDLFQPALIDGDQYLTAVSPLRVGVEQIESRQAAWGGVLARYLVPHVTRLEKQANPNASGAEAYSWLPPPLIGEGNKVQSAWLHDFLLEPYPIRPATFLRMPKFNMTSDEATALVNYFSAVDNADYPYAMSPQRLDSQLAAHARQYARNLDQAGVAPEAAQSWSRVPIDQLIERRFDDALKIVVDGNYCVKCHKVGDFDPAARDRAKAPQLTEIYRRIRPDYLRRWLAKPATVLPYTSMPENIKYEPEKPFQGGVSQDLYHGTSTEQVDALVDLLLNYDTYARRGRKIADMVKPIPTPAEGAPPATTGSTGP